MGFHDCVDEALRGGEISPEEAAELKSRYDSEFKRGRGQGDPAADVSAKANLSAELRAEAADKKRRALLSAKALSAVDSNLSNFRNFSGEKDVAEAAVALLEHRGTAAYSSIDGRRNAIIGLAHARIGEFLGKHERTKLTGRTPGRADLDNVVREAFGEKTGDDSAAAFAKAWLGTAEWLRGRFNRAGGAIGKLDQWGMPQIHKRSALKKAGLDQWKAQVRPKLDPARMRHPLTGRPIHDDELDAVLTTVWETITSDGWTKREPKQQPFGKGPVAKQHADHRFLVFKDADSWLDYQRDFGEGNPLAAMMQHINMMARDIASIELLGPNPNMMMEYVKQRIAKEAGEKNAGKPADFAGKGDPVSRANRKLQLVENMWSDLRGNLETPVMTGAANFLSGTRNLITSSVLGQAFLSAFTTDTMYQKIARSYAGLPVMGTFRSITKQLRKGDRMTAVRSGLILDSAMHMLTTNARYLGTFSGPGWTRWLADRVLAVSWLTPWTQAARHAFGLEVMGAIADHAGKAFGELDPAFRRLFERYGFEASDWDRVRATPAHDDRGGTYVRPVDIAATDERLAERLLEMIVQETEYAVPSQTIRGRATFFEANQPGTFWGEMARSAGMFKSFAITFALLQGQRTAELVNGRGAWHGARYVGAVALTTTLGGALSLWLKDVANGRDPRPIAKDGNPLPFFTAAFLQGGGIGIFGDFLFGDLNRYGGGLASTLSGPLIQRGSDFLNLTIGNIAQLAAGEDTKFVEEARRFAGRMTPGGNLWYLQLGYKRVMLDQLQYLTDPDANRSFKRKQRRFLKDFGSGHWWAPGELAPDRPPELDVSR